MFIPLLSRLQLMKVVVNAVRASQQFLMGSGLGYVPFIHHHNPVSHPHG